MQLHPMDAEQGSRLGLVSARGLERANDGVALRLGAGLGERARGHGLADVWRCEQEVCRDVLGDEDLASGQGHCALEDVLQLPHISISSGEMDRMGSPDSVANLARKWPASSGMSSRLSRKGGMRMGMT
jgi:hypothetical protein